MRNNRRMLSILLAFVMVFSMLPMSSMAYAADDSTTYTVKFDSAGGSAVEEQIIAASEKAKEPDAPTRDGYVFIGWFTEKDEAFDFSTPINEDLTLTAKWTENALTADDAQNNETEIIDDQSEDAAPVEADAEGVDGVGDQDTEAVTCGNQPTEGNTVGVDDVEADNTSETDNSDATDGTVSEETENDDAATDSEVPLESDVQAQTRALRTSTPVILMSANVSGTIYASSLTDNDDLVLTGDTTLVMDVNRSLKSISGAYALTVQGGNTLTINSSSNAINVSSLTIASNVQATSSSSDVFCIEVENDISFSGGSLLASGAGGIRSKNGNITLDGDVTATGSISAGILAPNGTVTIKSGTIRATGASSGSGRWQYGIGALRSVLVQGGTVTVSGNYGIYAEDGYIYLSGTITANGVDLAIYAKNGTLEMHGAITAKSTGTDYPCVYSDGNITFSGTKLEATGGAGIRSLNGDITLDGDVTATGSISAGILAHNGTVTIKSGTVTATGATSGEGRWHYGIGALNDISVLSDTTKVVATGERAMYAENGTITIESPLKILEPINGVVNGHVIVDTNGDAATYAVIAKTYTITFNANGGTVSPTSATTNIEGKLTSLPTPTRDGYNFTGWYSAASGGSSISLDKVYTENTTIYAHWARKTYTITFDPNGGTVSPTSATTNSEGRLDSLPTPTREGYTFLNWCSEPTGGYSIGTSKIYTADTTIYAHWVKKSYTVTFDSHSGSAVPSQTVEHGDKASRPADPTRGGFTFDDWYADAAYTTKFDFDTPITAPRTIYAKWTPILLSFTVDFDVDGGSAVPSQTVTEGGKVTKPDDPTKEGFTFAGWYANSRKTRAFDFENTEIYEDTTIYAKWVENGTQRYYVTFLYGSHTLASQRVYSGGYATRPTSVIPPEHGLVFVDWYADSELTTLFDFENTPITGNTRVYSKWVAGYVVTFEPKNGDLIEINVEGGKTVEKPDDPIKEGFTFGGWYTDWEGTEAFDFSTPITEDIKLYAKWIDNTPTAYTVSFNANGGTGTMAPVTVNIGDKLTLPECGFTPQEGKEFDRWDAGIPGEQVDIVSNCTITAIWREKTATYTVTFEANGHGTAPATQTVNNGETANEPTAPSESGWTFGGWYTEAACTNKFDFDTAITGDITLYAKWTEESVVPPVPVTYTVTFETNGGSAVATQTVNSGEKATKPADPAKSGFVFDGWYQDAAFAAAFDFDTPITADVTIYAKWKEEAPAPATYTVTFDTNGHGTAPAAQTVNSGETAKEPTAPSESGWIFGGWYTEAACTTKFDFGTAITGDITLYAKWTEESVAPPAPTTYTVTFDANGHGTAPAAQTVNSGDTAIEPTAPTESGWTFGGWYQDATCSVAFDFATAITADITLYAKWTKEATPEKIVYTVVSGGNSTWTKGSSSGVTIVVKRNLDDDTCFSHFTSVQIDGTTLAASDYDAKAGSTVITLKAATLQKLSTGSHTVTINFDDGSAATKLTIKAASSRTDPTSPQTGDDSHMSLWIVLMILSATGLCGTAYFGRKRRYVSKH